MSTMITALLLLGASSILQTIRAWRLHNKLMRCKAQLAAEIWKGR